MPHNSRSVSEATPKEALGSLGGCLVEGDPEQRSRERRVRRRSLVISILTQAAVVALLILLPLFGRTEHLALSKTFIPFPPYGHAPHHPAGPTTTPTGHPPIPPGTLTFFSPVARPITPTNPGDDTVGPPVIGPGGDGLGSGPACSWCVDIGGNSSGPRPPQPVVERASKPPVIYKTTIDPAMLIRRVEPIYPALARQIHREGRVEMRARIATDGTIESLEIVSGDPIFYQSAKDAVSQWLYRATVLNGQKVEVDTYVTVIYTMAH
ncbi:MAG TPA: energy transducer TonB [Candidatus Acidoferrum sp.]|nr:energy transducer TonB [Candidatus Acidoferrum sp.]